MNLIHEFKKNHSIVWGRNCSVARVAEQRAITGTGYYIKFSTRRPSLGAVLVSSRGTLGKSPYLNVK